MIKILVYQIFSHNNITISTYMAGLSDLLCLCLYLSKLIKQGFEKDFSDMISKTESNQLKFSFSIFTDISVGELPALR